MKLTKEEKKEMKLLHREVVIQKENEFFIQKPLNEYTNEELVNILSQHKKRIRKNPTREYLLKYIADILDKYQKPFAIRHFGDFTFLVYIDDPGQQYYFYFKRNDSNEFDSYGCGSYNTNYESDIANIADYYGNENKRY